MLAEMTFCQVGLNCSQYMHAENELLFYRLSDLEHISLRLAFVDASNA